MQHWEYVRLKLQLRHLQVRTLHLRKFRRAVLPYKHLRDRHRLRNERSGLYFKHQQPHIDVPAVWKERRSVLRKLHLHRRRHAVPQQQLFIHVFVQGVRRHWPGLLLKLHIHRPCVQGSRNGLRHHQQCLHGLWLRRRPLLRQQYLQRCKHGVQELSLCRVRHAGLDLFNRRSLLRGQHLQERMLCHALRWFVLRLSNLSLRRHGLRHPCQQHDRSSLRLDHRSNRHLHERHHFLRWPQPSLLRLSSTSPTTGLTQYLCTACGDKGQRCCVDSTSSTTGSAPGCKSPYVCAQTYTTSGYSYTCTDSTGTATSTSTTTGF